MYNYYEESLENLFRNEEDIIARKKLKSYKKYKRKGGNLSFDDWNSREKREYESYKKYGGQLPFNAWKAKTERERYDEMTREFEDIALGTAKLDYQNIKNMSKYSKKLAKYETKIKQREASYLIPNKKSRTQISGIPKNKSKSIYKNSTFNNSLYEDIEFLIETFDIPYFDEF